MTSYTVSNLAGGWVWRSPAMRIETVVRTAPAPQQSWLRLVWTDHTGPDSWVLPAGTEAQAIPPAASSAEIRIIDRPRSAGWPGRITAELTPTTAGRYTTGYVLAEAGPTADGGWAVTVRSGAGELITTRHEAKAKARTAIRRIVRDRAKALRIAAVREESR